MSLQAALMRYLTKVAGTGPEGAAWAKYAQALKRGEIIGGMSKSLYPGGKLPPQMTASLKNASREAGDSALEYLRVGGADPFTDRRFRNMAKGLNEVEPDEAAKPYLGDLDEWIAKRGKR